MRQSIFVLLAVTTSVARLSGAGGTLKNAAQPLLWSGTVAKGSGPTTEIPECAPGCQRFDVTVDLPGGVWNNKPGGVQIAIRWTGQTLGNNLRLYVYRGTTLIAKSDGIISIAQGVLLREAPDGLLKVYVAVDPDSPSASVSYDGLAEVEYDSKPHPLRQLLPDLESRPQRNLGFDPGGVFFDEISPDFPSCYQTEVIEENAHNCLRFDQIFANTGEGAMELRFSVPHGSTATHFDAFQRIYWSDSTNHYSDVFAGQVEFHPEHGHYHYDSFGLSRLWRVDIFGKKAGVQPLRERRLKRTVQISLARSGRKVSFCMADTEIDSWARKGDGPRTYNAPDCLLPASSDAVNDYYLQGITAGWGDIYDWYLPDQYIEVTGVADGLDILETLADPDRRLKEEKENNNCVSIFVRLAGMGSAAPKATILGRGPACSLLPN